jgi:hypothetical protein
MCDKVKDINGRIFAHEHKVNKEVIFWLPEQPDKRDWEVIKDYFPGETIKYIIRRNNLSKEKENDLDLPNLLC